MHSIFLKVINRGISIYQMPEMTVCNFFLNIPFQSCVRVEKETCEGCT